MPYNTSRILNWRGNTESDMDHYRIYVGTVALSSSGNFDSTGLTGGLGSTAQPAMRVSGLADSVQYFFSITAWDVNGNESTFSSPEVTVTPIVPLTRILRQVV